MKHQSDEQEKHEPASQRTSHPSKPAQPRYLLVAWVLLLLVGAFFLFASFSDLAADARSGLPSDHLEAFQMLAGISWTAAGEHIPSVCQST